MKRLILIPFLFAIVTAVGMFLPPDTGANYHRTVLIAIGVITGASAFLTMTHFRPGDRLFSCWFLIGSSASLAIFRYILHVITLVSGTAFNQTMLNTMLILQNVTFVLGLWSFVAAWKATGLAAPGSRATRVLSILAGIAVAVVVGGYPLAKGLQDATSVDPLLLISTLGDMCGIALIVPLVIPALALRGGVLMRIWIYLAACESTWLTFDIWYATRPSLPLAMPTARGIEEGIRMIAIGFVFIASVAQRRLLRD